MIIEVSRLYFFTYRISYSCMSIQFGKILETLDIALVAVVKKE